MPVDHRGFPIPYFVKYVDGVADFRIADEMKLVECHKHEKCWLCGEKLGTFKAFVVGPMCAINRTSGEPPSHRDCAEFAAKACPFLIRPKMKRNEKDLPENKTDGAGVMLKRNPGVTLIWITKSYKPFRVDNGVLFEMGDPLELVWLAEGRPATREEILGSIDSGLPLLQEMADKDPDAAGANRELADRYSSIVKVLPEAA